MSNRIQIGEDFTINVFEDSDVNANYGCFTPTRLINVESTVRPSQNRSNILPLHAQNSNYDSGVPRTMKQGIIASNNPQFGAHMTSNRTLQDIQKPQTGLQQATGPKHYDLSTSNKDCGAKSEDGSVKSEESAHFLLRKTLLQINSEDPCPYKKHHEANKSIQSSKNSAPMKKQVIKPAQKEMQAGDSEKTDVAWYDLQSSRGMKNNTAENNKKNPTMRNSVPMKKQVMKLTKNEGQAGESEKLDQLWDDLRWFSEKQNEKIKKPTVRKSAPTKSQVKKPSQKEMLTGGSENTDILWDGLRWFNLNDKERGGRNERNSTVRAQQPLAKPACRSGDTTFTKPHEQAKPKRGRPAKIPKTPATSTKPDEPNKQKRGRPPKIPDTLGPSTNQTSSNSKTMKLNSVSEKGQNEVNKPKNKSPANKPMGDSTIRTYPAKKILLEKNLSLSSASVFENCPKEVPDPFDKDLHNRTSKSLLERNPSNTSSDFFQNPQPHDLPPRRTSASSKPAPAMSVTQKKESRKIPQSPKTPVSKTPASDVSVPLSGGEKKEPTKQKTVAKTPRVALPATSKPQSSTNRTQKEKKTENVTIPDSTVKIPVRRTRNNSRNPPNTVPVPETSRTNSSKVSPPKNQKNKIAVLNPQSDSSPKPDTSEPKNDRQNLPATILKTPPKDELQKPPVCISIPVSPVVLNSLKAMVSNPRKKGAKSAPSFSKKETTGNQGISNVILITPGNMNSAPLRPSSNENNENSLNKTADRNVPTTSKLPEQISTASQKRNVLLAKEEKIIKKPPSRKRAMPKRFQESELNLSIVILEGDDSPVKKRSRSNKMKQNQNTPVPSSNIMAKQAVAGVKNLSQMKITGSVTGTTIKGEVEENVCQAQIKDFVEGTVLQGAAGRKLPQAQMKDSVKQTTLKNNVGENLSQAQTKDSLKEANPKQQMGNYQKKLSQAKICAEAIKNKRKQEESPKLDMVLNDAFNADTVQASFMLRMNPHEIDFVYAVISDFLNGMIYNQRNPTSLACSVGQTFAAKYGSPF